MKQQIHHDGYRWITLSSKSAPCNASVHRLVAKAFIPNPDNKPQVNHKDGNKQNNVVSNLEWVTQSENTLHAFRTGLISPKSEEAKKRIGSAARKTVAKCCSIPIICTTDGRRFDSIQAAAKFYQVDTTTIQALLRHWQKDSIRLPGYRFEFQNPEITNRTKHRLKSKNKKEE